MSSVKAAYISCLAYGEQLAAFTGAWLNHNSAVDTGKCTRDEGSA